MEDESPEKRGVPKAVIGYLGVVGEPKTRIPSSNKLPRKGQGGRVELILTYPIPHSPSPGTCPVCGVGKVGREDLLWLPRKEGRLRTGWRLTPIVWSDPIISLPGLEERLTPQNGLFPSLLPTEGLGWAWLGGVWAGEAGVANPCPCLPRLLTGAGAGGWV